MNENNKEDVKNIDIQKESYDEEIGAERFPPIQPINDNPACEFQGDNEEEKDFAGNSLGIPSVISGCSIDEARKFLVTLLNPATPNDIKVNMMMA